MLIQLDKTIAAVAVIGTCCWAPAFSAPSRPKLTIRVLSGPSDMVSGGDALIELSGFSLYTPHITLNARDVTSQFRPGRTPGTLLGRIEGLRIGSNALEVRAGRQQAKLQLVNYPITGPIFSGPHPMPFICQTKETGLGEPLDNDCSAETIVRYEYWSTGRAQSGVRPGFKPFDASGPLPPDTAKTTTTGGKTVNFIVRRETGTINRAIYEISFLHEPGEPLPDPWTDSPGWNRRLVYLFGGGVGTGFHQGTLSPGRSPQLEIGILAEGYAEATSSLNLLANTSDDVFSAETLLMVKEHFIKTFGPPAHTIGWGPSGGAIQQHLIAQNYPGLLDGIIPMQSFPDLFTAFSPVVECGLLAHASIRPGSHGPIQKKQRFRGTRLGELALTG